jgi:hypothetical protein
MRDSAALRFSTWMARLLIVLPRRFWIAPSEPRSELIVLIAASMLVIAVVVVPPEPMSSEFSASEVLSAADRLTDSVSMPVVVPKPTWKLTELDEPSSSLMPLNSVERPMRLTSLTRLWNSSFSVSLSGVADRAVARLDRQFAQAGQDRADLVERAFGGLHEGDAVVGVALGLLERADLRAQAFGDRQAGGVVGRGRDAQAGRQRR